MELLLLFSIFEKKMKDFISLNNSIDTAFLIFLFDFSGKKLSKYFGMERKSFYLCTRFPDERGGLKERAQAVFSSKKEIFEKFPYTFFFDKAVVAAKGRRRDYFFPAVFFAVDDP